MRLLFAATDGGAGENEFGLFFYLCGRDAAGATHYLALRREVESARPTTDWGVHLEFDCHINATYDCVARCYFRSTTLSIDLTKGLGPLKRGDGIDVEFAFGEDLERRLRDVLLRIFREREGILDLA